MSHVLLVKDGSTSAEIKAKKNGYWSMRSESFTQTWNVTSSSINETYTQAIANLALPQIGTKVGNCWCKSIKPKETCTVFVNGEPRILWEVEYAFDSDAMAGGLGGGQSGDPTKWPVEIEWSTATYKELWFYDKSNPPKNFENSVGEAMPVEVDVRCPCLKISRYEPYVWGGHWILAIVGYLNSAEFAGFLAGQCLIDDVTATREEINGGYYFHVTYKILIRPADSSATQPFTMKLLDQGTKIKESIDGEEQIVTTQQKYGQTKTVNLNGAGGVLAEGAPPVELEFNIYQSFDFNDLGFNLSEDVLPLEAWLQDRD